MNRISNSISRFDSNTRIHLFDSTRILEFNFRNRIVRIRVEYLARGWVLDAVSLSIYKKFSLFRYAKSAETHFPKVVPTEIQHWSSPQQASLFSNSQRQRSKNRCKVFLPIHTCLGRRGNTREHTVSEWTLVWSPEFIYSRCTGFHHERGFLGKSVEYESTTTGEVWCRSTLWLGNQKSLHSSVRTMMSTPTDSTYDTISLRSLHVTTIIGPDAWSRPMKAQPITLSL